MVLIRILFTQQLLLVLFLLGVELEAKTPRLKADWHAVGQKELQDSLHQKINERVAKNVILFLGDGMGISTITAARIFKGQQKKAKDAEAFKLSFDQFPHLALIKTYCEDRITPDSAATATAYLSGVKVNKGVIGLDARMKHGQCSEEFEASKVDSILKWSLKKGKSVGVVTSTRVTHATPAGTYAHTPNRDWECDTDIPKDTPSRCKDIASQLVKDNPDIQVILGGGREKFLPKEMKDPEYPTRTGKRGDKKDLTKVWLEHQKSLNRSAKYVWNVDQFDQVDPKKTDYLLGLFEPSHLIYEMDRERKKNKDPTLLQLAEKAVEILQKNDKGFFLLIEGGRIDHGHHENRAKAALTETMSFDDAVIRVKELVNEDETLIVVTADHSHVFNLAGYPERGTDLLGQIPLDAHENGPLDDKPMTILVYGNGPGYNSTRQNLTGIETNVNSYHQQSAVPLEYETHGGEDLAVFARGPMSHIFRGVREQVFIPTALAYASCVGQNLEHCRRQHIPTNTPANPASGLKVPMIPLLLFLLLCNLKFFN